MSASARQVTRFRKKPVEVEAMRWDGSLESIRAICEWVNSPDRDDDPTISYLTNNNQPYGVVVWTLEGEMKVAPGDWIIRGVKGEFYSCKPGIFALTYESALAASPLVEENEELATRITELERLLLEAAHRGPLSSSGWWFSWKAEVRTALGGDQ
jgi:hypothetical protein